MKGIVKEAIGGVGCSIETLSRGSESGSSELALGFDPLNSSFSLVLLSVSNSVGNGYESVNCNPVSKISRKVNQLRRF